jgi:DNA-binding LacI/PurR family transcriptional regulator
VARVAGVGKSTVSLVLGNKGRTSAKTRQIVLDAARDLGFVVNPHARRLTNGRCDELIAMFSYQYGTGPIGRKLQYIQHALNAAGYDAPLYTAASQDFDYNVRAQADILRRLRAQRPRAIIGTFLNIDGLDRSYLDELVKYMNEGGIIVNFDMPPPVDCDHIVFDREHNTYMAARHLIELGHRKIAFFTAGPPPDGARLAGFLAAMKEFGVPVRDDWFWNGGIYEQAGEVLAEIYLNAKERPTALCVLNDFAAATFISIVQRHGLKVPGDISVVGHDNEPYARYGSVPLTTMTHPVEEIAGSVVDLLMSRLSGDYTGPSREIVIRGELIQRESAASPA